MVKAPPEWGIEPVPDERRILGTLDYAVLWSSLGVGLLVMQAGALLVQWLGLNLWEALLVSLVGSVAGSAILALASVPGARYGVPTMVSLRPVLGVRGTYLPTVLNVVQLVGWTTFEMIIMGEAATAVSGELMGPYTKYLWMTVFGVWCYLLAVLGPLAVVRQWLEKFAIWLVYASSAWITYQLLRVSPAGGGGAGLPEFLLALDLVIAMPVSWMPLVSDYNRFARSVSKGVLGTFLGYTIANTWFYWMGAALAAAYPRESVVYSIALLYLGVLAVAGILVDETDNAFADIYSAAVSLQNIAPRARQWKLALGITLASLVLAYTVPIAQYEHFLLLIGASFVPLFGVLISDYFLVRRGRYGIDEFYGRAPGIRAAPLVAWAVGFTVYYILAYCATWAGVGATLPSLLTSLILHYALSRASGVVR